MTLPRNMLVDLPTGFPRGSHDEILGPVRGVKLPRCPLEPTISRFASISAGDVSESGCRHVRTVPPRLLSLAIDSPMVALDVGVDARIARSAVINWSGAIVQITKAMGDARCSQRPRTSCSEKVDRSIIVNMHGVVQVARSTQILADCQPRRQSFGEIDADNLQFMARSATLAATPSNGRPS